MKKMLFTLSLLVIFISANIVSSSAQVAGWLVTQPGMGVGVCADQFNNTFTCGQFVGTTTIGNYTFTSAGVQDVVVEKYDPSGILLWASPFGGPQGDFSSNICYDGLGNVWVTGQFSGTMTAGNFTLVSAGGTDAFIIKMDAVDGTIIYAERCGGTGSDAGASVKADPSGNVYFTGTFYGVASFNSTTITSQGSMDIFIIKITNAGVPLWGAKIGGTNIEAMWSAATDAQGNVYIGGFTTSASAYFAGTLVSFSAQTQFIAKINANGTYAWSTVSEFNGEVVGICTDAAGSVYFTGNYDTQATIGPFTLTGVGNDEILLAKINSNGTFAWARSYGGTGIDEGYGIDCNPQGDVFLVGTFQGIFTFGSTNLNAGSFTKSYLAKIDSAGTVTWVIQSGGSASAHFTKGVALNGSDIYFTGSGNGFLNVGSITDSLHECYLVKVADNANIIKGIVFRDVNNDGIFDPGETGIPNVILELDNSPYVTASNNAGIYEMYTNIGSHEVNIPDLPLYHTLTTPLIQTAIFSGMGAMDTANHFGLYPVPNVNDLRIDITPVTCPNAGYVLTYLITYTNIGTATLNATVTLQSDPAIFYLNASPSPATQNGQTTTWNLGSLAPQATGTIHAQFNIPSNLTIGYPVTADVGITPVVNDTTPADNSQHTVSLVTGPYDPNYKTVNIDTLYSVSNSGWLEYIVHFQNIGNDTAHTVIISDALSQHLDLASFQMIASTHPVSAFNIKNGNEAEFRFNNIMLPDSATDPIGSIGFVKYRIKYLSTLPVNDSIVNFADIYFDYNAPVRTAHAVTYYVSGSAIGEAVNYNNIRIFPNPASDILNITMNNSETATASIRIFDARGELILQKLNIESKGSINTSFQIAALRSGVYFIEIFDGERMHHAKMVKQ